MSSRPCPPVKASRKSCKIPMCFDTEVSELPAVASPPLKKREHFHFALQCQQCALNRGGSTSSIGRWDAVGTHELARMLTAVGTRELARMLTALPWLLNPLLWTLPADVAMEQRLCRSQRTWAGDTARNRACGLGYCGCRWVFQAAKTEFRKEPYWLGKLGWDLCQENAKGKSGRHVICSQIHWRGCSSFTMSC